MSIYGNTPEEVIDLFLKEKWGKDYSQHYVSRVKRNDMAEKIFKNKTIRSRVNKFKLMNDAEYKALIKKVLDFA